MRHRAGDRALAFEQRGRRGGGARKLRDDPVLPGELGEDRGWRR
jgi:hypothetical protein